MSGSQDRHILLLITDLDIGGTPTVVRELASRLQRHARISVASLKRPGPIGQQIRQHGIEVHDLGATGVVSFPSAVGRLRRIVEQENIDTVFSFLVHANTVAATVRKIVPFRLIQSMQTVQPRPRWHWWLMGMVAAQAETIVVPSRAIVSAAVERSGIDPGRFTVIPNAVDLVCPPGGPVGDNSKVRIGFLGRLDPVKRVGELIRAVELLENPRVELHIYGNGSEYTRILRQASASRATVRMYGQVEGPAAVFGNLDLFVLPSVDEGFGLVLIESMAAGVPVIAMNAGGSAEVVSDGVNGLLVDPKQGASGIARAICRMLDDDSLRQTLIEGGLRTVRQRYTWDAVLPMYRRVLAI
jgi:glycosyltransferase involved in cell wall biosynthesis